MDTKKLVEEVTRKLAEDIGCRPTGSAENVRAYDYLRELFAEIGCAVSTQEFEATGWESGGIRVEIDGAEVPAVIDPYSLPFDREGTAEVYRDLESLGKEDLRGRIVVLDGELAAETVFPKSFEYYNPDHHRALVAALEAGAPALVLALRDMDLPDSLTGAVGRRTLEPLFNDADLLFPSATVERAAFEKARRGAAPLVRARGEGTRAIRRSGNVVARTGDPAGKKIVLVAHLDTFFGTPGALDDASGIAFLATAASSLRDAEGAALEIVAVNGEDHYANPGEKALLDHLMRNASTITLGVNVDGLGYRGADAALSFYGTDEATEAFFRSRALGRVAVGDPWPQGDHMLFGMAGIPAVALTSSPLDEYLRTCHHGPEDTCGKVDFGFVAEAAAWLAAALRELPVR